MNDESRIMDEVILLIDSSRSDRVKVGLKFEGKTRFITSKAKVLRAQAILPLIDKILKRNKLTLKDIKKIEVYKGIGSFTGLRVGIAIANALSFTLGIPVNDKEVGETETPVY